MDTLIQQVLSENVTVGDLRRTYAGAVPSSFNVFNAGADLVPSYNCL
ncbi:hypothetical protein T01_1527 [Trichinella spiralis]|uniref:Uncharacterized protein n=1 Tax=Trichinella spiralis TaxID=6334 RepID=A0A0V0Z4B1_TRISP|nr:hypothetical protein T01_1527 [Trichinella spiralis]